MEIMNHFHPVPTVKFVNLFPGVHSMEKSARWFVFLKQVHDYHFYNNADHPEYVFMDPDNRIERYEDPEEMADLFKELSFELLEDSRLLKRNITVLLNDRPSQNKRMTKELMEALLPGIDLAIINMNTSKKNNIEDYVREHPALVIKEIAVFANENSGGVILSVKRLMSEHMYCG